MDVFSGKQLVLFILFAVPGFLALKVYDVMSGRDATAMRQQVYDLIAYSCLIHVVVGMPFLIADRCWSGVFGSIPHGFIVLFVAPIFGPIVYRKVRLSQFSQRYFPHPTGVAWDFIFAQRKGAYVIVTLKNDTKLGGWYGSNSFASSSSCSESIYIEQAFHINEYGGFDDAKASSSGILITADQIALIEFYNPSDGGSADDGQRELTHTNEESSIESDSDYCQSS